jgi:hypothetical protein
MLGGVEERDSAIVMGSPSRDVTDVQQGHAYKAAPGHKEL